MFLIVVDVFKTKIIIANIPFSRSCVHLEIQVKVIGVKGDRGGILCFLSACFFLSLFLSGVVDADLGLQGNGVYLCFFGGCTVQFDFLILASLCGCHLVFLDKHPT